MILQLVLLIVLLATGMVLSVVFKKLTVLASVTGGAVAIIIFFGAGYTGVINMAAFFLIATLATAWKRNYKEALGVAERHKGKRNAWQVLANSGAAALFAFITTIYHNDMVFPLLVSAVFASAIADTVSAELGMVYGKHFYNILTFKPDKRGLDGVISLQGTIAGILASAVIAWIHCIGYGWSLDFAWIIIAGTVGNLSDSVLGATVERKGSISNDLVNFLNTMIAALAAYILHLLQMLF
jgi:uncharacterized protein (TIGR00297 family)